MGMYTLFGKEMLMKFWRKIFSRVVLVSLAIALQLAWLFFILFYLSAYYLPIAFVFNMLSLLVVVYIVNRPGNPQVKLAWIVPILVFPLFGGIIFMISGGKGPKKKLRRALDKSGALLSITQTLDTYIYRSLSLFSDPNKSTAAGLYQSIVGLILVCVANWIVDKIDSDSAMF